MSAFIFVSRSTFTFICSPIFLLLSVCPHLLHNLLLQIFACQSLSVCLSVLIFSVCLYLFVCLYVCIYLPGCPTYFLRVIVHTIFLYTPIYLFICFCSSKSVGMDVCLLVYKYSFFCMDVNTYLLLPVCLSVRPFVHCSFHPSVCPSIHWSINIFSLLSLCLQTIFLKYLFLSVCS